MARRRLRVSLREAEIHLAGVYANTPFPTIAVPILGTTFRSTNRRPADLASAGQYRLRSPWRDDGRLSVALNGRSEGG